MVLGLANIILCRSFNIPSGEEWNGRRIQREVNRVRRKTDTQIDLEPGVLGSEFKGLNNRFAICNMTCLSEEIRNGEMASAGW